MLKICKTILMSYKEGYSEDNGVKIFYRDYGPKEATPVLLVHGLGAQLVHWPEHLIEFLIQNNLRPIKTSSLKHPRITSSTMGWIVWCSPWMPGRVGFPKCKMMMCCWERMLRRINLLR